MAVNKVALPAPPTGSEYIKDDSVGATAVVVTQNKKLAHLVVDNSLNSSETFLKIYDSSAPTVGTTDPDIVIQVPASSKLSVSFLDSKPSFTNLAWAALTTPGTGGTTGPTNSVVVEALVHD